MGKSRRIKVNFTVSENSIDKINKFMNDNCFDKSLLAEKLLLEYIENYKKVKK